MIRAFADEMRSTDMKSAATKAHAADLSKTIAVVGFTIGKYDGFSRDAIKRAHSDCTMDVVLAAIKEKLDVERLKRCTLSYKGAVTVLKDAATAKATLTVVGLIGEMVNIVVYNKGAKGNGLNVALGCGGEAPHGPYVDAWHEKFDYAGALSAGGETITFDAAWAKAGAAQPNKVLRAVLVEYAKTLLKRAPKTVDEVLDALKAESIDAQASAGDAAFAGLVGAAGAPGAAAAAPTLARALDGSRAFSGAGAARFAATAKALRGGRPIAADDLAEMERRLAAKRTDMTFVANVVLKNSASCEIALNGVAVGVAVATGGWTMSAYYVRQLSGGIQIHAPIPFVLKEPVGDKWVVFRVKGRTDLMGAGGKKIWQAFKAKYKEAPSVKAGKLLIV